MDLPHNLFHGTCILIICFTYGTQQKAVNFLAEILVAVQSIHHMLALVVGRGLWSHFCEGQ